MRIPTKVDYAVRAMIQLAADADQGPVPAARLAAQQCIPLKFLHSLLTELKRARLVRSLRGPEGGFELTGRADEITMAAVLRAVDGPLFNVHDACLATLSYPGHARPLVDVWMAARASLRNVFETVTLADLVADKLPFSVADLAVQYTEDDRHA